MSYPAFSFLLYIGLPKVSIPSSIFFRLPFFYSSAWPAMHLFKVMMPAARRLKPGSIQTQSLALRALHIRKPQETQALALASSQSWLPLLRPSIPIGWRLRCVKISGKRLRFLRFSFTRSNDCVWMETGLRLCDRCFAAAGPRLWNLLPLHLSDTLEQLKRLLKIFLFGLWDHGALWH